ncbi:hypothetical protein AR687_02385 [Flavobacteriaceae bacterium CRH]|nr:hypothetical protein AR687_02385 [Flavobacteriaceae bacterium CRH]
MILGVNVFVSGFRFQVSGFRFQVSGFRFQVSLHRASTSLSLTRDHFENNCHPEHPEASGEGLFYVYFF